MEKTKWTKVQPHRKNHSPNIYSIGQYIGVELRALLLY